MQAIRTHHIPATNYKGSRVKAQCERGSIVVSYDSAESSEAAHAYAVRTLLNRFIAEDEKRYGTLPEENPWDRPFVSGGLPDGSIAHVLLPKS